MTDISDTGRRRAGAGAGAGACAEAGAEAEAEAGSAYRWTMHEPASEDRPMVQASGVRIGWADLPANVRDSVAGILGEPVVEAVSQSGGFSPGTADRVTTASGRRAFVKAV